MPKKTSVQSLTLYSQIEQVFTLLILEGHQTSSPPVIKGTLK